MATPPRILAFAGSTRKDSLNKKLVPIAAAGARAAGADVTIVDLRDYPLPLYDGDLEEAEGQPANAAAFKQLMMDHDGLLIASPEYNSSVTAVLKNTIDWVSRPFLASRASWLRNGGAREPPRDGGGLRGLAHTRSILGNIGVLVIPAQVTLPQANHAFEPDGTLKDDSMTKRVEGLGASLAEILHKLNA